ncbi:MAG TPA: hypothetical protein VH702_18700 [Vicinamibacterales bacterium]
MNVRTSVVGGEEISLAGELSPIGLMAAGVGSSQLYRAGVCCLSCGQGMFVITPGTPIVSAQP